MPMTRNIPRMPIGPPRSRARPLPSYTLRVGARNCLDRYFTITPSETVRTMDQLGSMRLFIAVAEARGFAAAARALRVSPPVVTRTVAALEDRLGVRLLNRTTRQVHLTEAGARYLDDCRRIIADVQAAEDRARGARREPQGVLAITAPLMFGRMHLAPLLHAFTERHAKVSVR